MKKLLLILLFAAPMSHATSEGDELIATIININGHLCAKVKRVNPLRQAGIYEVTCTKYRGGTATQIYMVNSNTGAAWID
jgi:hypothetical protein